MFSIRSGTRFLLITLLFAASLCGYLRIPFVWVVPEVAEDSPALSVMLSWNRTDPSLMETKAVQLLERGISLCEGVDRIFSVTKPDGAFIYISPKDPAQLEELFVQVQMQLRRLSSSLPQGVSWPVLHHTAQRGETQRLLSVIWHGLDTTPRLLSRRLNGLLKQNRLEKQVSLRLSGQTYREELQILYDPVCLQQLDVTPDELFQQITTALDADMQPGSISVKGKIGGRLPLGALATVTRASVPVYPLIKVNSQPAWQIDFVSGAKVNHWWLSYKLANILDDFQNSTLAPFLAEKISHFSALCLRQTQSAGIVLSCLLVLLLAAGWYLRCWKRVRLLLAGFWMQLGLLLLVLSVVQVPITLTTLQLLLMGEILFLLPLWLSLVRPSAGTANMAYFWVFAGLGFSVLDMLQFDPPSFHPSPVALAMFTQVLSFGMVLFVLLPLCTNTPVRISQSPILTLQVPAFWMLTALFLPFFPFSSVSGEYQYLLKSYRHYLEQTDKAAKPEAHLQLQIELEAFPGVGSVIFESWVDRLGIQLQKEGTVITTLVDPRKAILLLPWKNPASHHYSRQILQQLQEHASNWANIHVSLGFNGANYSATTEIKKISYMLQVTGYNLFATNNWTDSLIYFLSLHPRIQEISRVNTSGVEQQLTIPFGVQEKGVISRNLERYLAFFEDRSWYYPSSQLRMLPKIKPVFLGKAQVPEWEWRQGDWWKRLPEPDYQSIVRLNQEYLNRIQFNFLGTAQTGGAVLQECLNQIRQKLPPGYQINISEGDLPIHAVSDLDRWVRLVAVMGGVGIGLFGFSGLGTPLMWLFGGMLPAFWIFSVGLAIPFYTESTFVQGWLWIWFLLPSLWLQFSGVLNVRDIVSAGLAYIGATGIALSLLHITPPYWMAWMFPASLSVTLWVGVIGWIASKRQDI